ncbi:amphi-Trp domain-containing protein [Halobacterium yunchengense]|uniref:amphi-Trp domain-containing protein n=1 Tax=Halobacterium yunchengense TaxID=3108497 RepID=UPI00300816FE
MAEETTSAESVSRAVAADRPNELASDLREGDVDVRVGNKEITLSPPDSVNYRVRVVEKSALFRGRRETVQVTLDWRPE